MTVFFVHCATNMQILVRPKKKKKNPDHDELVLYRLISLGQFLMALMRPPRRLLGLCSFLPLYV